MTETIRSHFPAGTEGQLQTVGSNVTEHGDKNPCQREGILNEGRPWVWCRNCIDGFFCRCYCKIWV